MSNISQEIKDRLDIVDVVQDYIKLEKSGANYRALCPFHQEKTPSFFVSQSKQIWHCFGACSEGGDVFSFIMKIEGVEYIDALRILANRAGIKLKKPDKETILQESEKEILYNICELASLFFEKQMGSSQGKLVQSYLLGRGLSQESIKEWRIGYAPDTWQGLTDFLINKGYSPEKIEKTGLIIKKESGDYFDRFRQRILFPIFDFNSRIIGFSGRIFDVEGQPQKQEAKYINSPSTILYNKSKALYGFNKAKLDIRKKDSCIIVEGQFDVIMLSQAGFKNVISVSGTALTVDHLRIIKRYTKNIYLCFDTDMAGESATKKSAEMAIAEDFNIKVVILPEGTDPADILQKPTGKSDFEEYLDKSISILAFYFNRTFVQFEGNSLRIEDKKKIIGILLPIIKKISNKVEESYWLRELAIRLNIRENVLEEELQKIKKTNQSSPQFLDKQSKKKKSELLEERIIILTLLFNEFLDLIDLDPTLGYSDKFIKIIKFIKESREIKDNMSTVKNLGLDYFLIKAEGSSIEKNEAEKELKLSLSEFRKIKRKEKRELTIHKIKEAEKAGSKSEVEVLIKQLQEL